MRKILNAAMPFKRIEIRKSTGKKTDTKKVIICECDFCGSEVEKRYKKKILEKYLEGNLLAFCNKECLHNATRTNGIMRKKMIETCIDVYGVDEPNKSQIVKDKIKATCQKKYNHSSYLGSDAHKIAIKEFYIINREKNLKRIKEIREKIQKTIQEKYGVEHITQSEVIRQRIRENCESKFGVNWPSRKPDVAAKNRDRLRSESFKRKRHNTLKKRGFYSKKVSKAENELFDLFITRYPDTQRHVNINNWNIDFYIPTIDCYVNYNGIYWHAKNISDEELINSQTKQSKIILETKKRDRERQRWFNEQNKLLIVIWEDEFVSNPTFETLESLFPIFKL